MCCGENNALHAASYFNTQLKGLWDIANECATHYIDPENSLKPDTRQDRYSFALAEFHYGKHRPGEQASEEDMMFHARFSAPTLRFLCNHEALFQIDLVEGHFNLDYSRASDNATANSLRNHLVTGTTFSFRVPFGTSGIKGNASMIGNGNHAFTLLVLDYRRAKLMSISPPLDQPSHQALESYLYAYLQFLQSAGHHVLFSLPNFSDVDDELLIDYSEVADEPLDLQEVHGVAIADINKYLSTSWLKAAMLASSQEGQFLDRPGISLAEYQSTWISQRADIHFHLTFGTPEVIALCDEEVIVHYIIDEALFYKSDTFAGEPLRTFSDWKIAVVFDLIYEKPAGEGDNVTLCRIDIARPRFLLQFSNFPGVHEEDQIDLRCRHRAAEFISGEYLTTLESGGFHVIYYHDLRWPRPSDDLEQLEDFASANEASWSATEVIEDVNGRTTKSAIWRNIIQASDMCGFDQITALSETAINHSFQSISATETLLQHWKYGDYLNVDLKPPTARLRSDGRVLLSIHLKSGSVRSLRNWQPNPEGDQMEFSNWRVTFQVDLKMSSHGELTGLGPEWQSMFEQSHIAKDVGSQSNVELKHIYLDLRRVQFLHELSHFEGLHSSQNKRFIDKIQAAVFYLREYYLPQFASAGHHILYTIPLWKTISEDFPHRLTHVFFQVYSNKGVGTSYTWSDNSRMFQPIIVIIGLCSGRPMIPQGFQYSTEWVAHAGKFSSCGTVGVSGELFLKGKLFPIVSQINAATTVIPVFSGIKQNEWNLRLTTWSGHPDRQDDCPPPPSLVEGLPDGLLKFSWKHHDKLDYEHKSRGHHIMDGTYSVTCDTENSLGIPTVYKQGTMTIELHGRVNLLLDVHLEDQGTFADWSSKASAEWAASLVVHSEASGLRVNVVSQPTMFKTLESTGDSGLQAASVLNPERLLKDIFPATIDMQPALRVFSLFASVWQSCYPGPSAYTLSNPVFNAKGDLLFELQPYTDPSSTSLDSSSFSPISPFLPGGKLGGKRDMFGRRVGTPQPRGPSRLGTRVGMAPPSEIRSNGRATSIERRISPRSVSPSIRTVVAPQPTRPASMMRHSNNGPNRPATPQADAY